jgi:C-terminal processing protease CtpA/Prc
MKLDDKLRSQVIEGAIAALHKEYVFPDVATKIEKRLREHVKAKRYDKVTAGAKLAKQLTEDVQAVSRDKHMSVQYSAEPIADDAPPHRGLPRDTRAEMRAHAAGFNAFFVKVERMAGNIGYLRLDAFVNTFVAAGPAAAAMTFIADTDALIIDLRHNGGGDPATVAMMVSYLYDGGESIHVSDIYWRSDDTTHQFWTVPDLAGRRYPDKPVYVLTSERTFSGAEDFAYAVRSLKRAKLIGEVTGGGAHPCGRRKLTTNFAIIVPMGRSISPITKTNWEAVGVKPHVKTAAADALSTAYLEALKAQRKRKLPKLPNWSPDLGAEIDTALQKAAKKK